MNNITDTDSRLAYIEGVHTGEPFVVQADNSKIYRVTTLYDETPTNPREDIDHASTMLCAHRRYTLGDDTLTDDEFEDLSKRIKANDPNEAILPLYFYEHGCCEHISTGPFNDPWDSGFIGFIYITREEWEKFYGMAWDKEKAKKALEQEVDIYDRYISGEIFDVCLEEWQPTRDDDTPKSEFGWGNQEFHGGCYGETDVHMTLLYVLGTGYKILDMDNLEEPTKKHMQAIREDIIEVDCGVCGGKHTISLYKVDGAREGYCKDCGTKIRVTKDL